MTIKFIFHFQLHHVSTKQHCSCFSDFGPIVVLSTYKYILCFSRWPFVELNEYV